MKEIEKFVQEPIPKSNLRGEFYKAEETRHSQCSLNYSREQKKNEGMKRQSEITQQMTMETQVAWQ